MDKPNPSIPEYPVTEYGAVEFESVRVPCAFGGEPGQLSAFVLVEGVCQIIGVSAEGEIERIQKNHLIADGLYKVKFPMLDPISGQTVFEPRPAISLQRLHTWLAMIPPDAVPDGVMRQKLANTQKHLVDVIYGYFGRRLLPADMRDEDDQYLTPSVRKLYEKLAEAADMNERLAAVEAEVADIRTEIGRIQMTIHIGEEGEYISADQQEALRAMIAILGNRYESNHGKGTRGRLLGDIKSQHNILYFSTVTKAQWPALVRDLVARFRRMHPAGTPLPFVFRNALESVEQGKLF